MVLRCSVLFYYVLVSCFICCLMLFQTAQVVLRCFTSLWFVVGCFQFSVRDFGIVLGGVRCSLVLSGERGDECTIRSSLAGVRHNSATTSPY